MMNEDLEKYAKNWDDAQPNEITCNVTDNVTDNVSCETQAMPEEDVIFNQYNPNNVQIS